MAEITLKPGRDKSVRALHPWIFSGAIARVDGDPQSGEDVLVRTDSGEALGWAAYSPMSQIRARMWNLQPDESIDTEFFRGRLKAAVQQRSQFIRASETDAYRLVHAESDGLPGLVVDRYADTLVVQVLSAGIERRIETLVDLLVETTGIQNIHERSDVEVRRLEGLPERTGTLRGMTPETILISENGNRFWVDVQRGQKTGFYLDQRRNRQIVGGLSGGRSVLNCFCYTGGFSIYALAQGAEKVLSIDSSADALAHGRENLRLNNLDEAKAEWMEGDIFQKLRLFRDQGKKFDMIILDPPKFAPTAAQAERAARGYKDINLLAFKLLNPGGLLATFSCSGGISPEFFQKIIAGAAVDASVNARIVEYLHQGPDHPVALSFPEGEYLKGLLCAI